MANYLFTDIAGTKRRRAHEITFRFPANGTPTVTFSEEDKVILADGTADIIPLAEKRVVIINQAFFEKEFDTRDIESGNVTGNKRKGAELFANVFSSIADVYVQTGIEKDDAEKAAMQAINPSPNS